MNKKTMCQEYGTTDGVAFRKKIEQSERADALPILHFEKLFLSEEVPSVSQNPQKKIEGMKFDTGKPQWHLLPFSELSEAVKVLTYRAEKYAPDNWKKLDNGVDRYMDAAYRHMCAFMNGSTKDEETGLHPLAHAIVSLLFAFWHARNKKYD